MALFRACDADGCHEEQPIDHDDDAHAFADREWLTLFCEEMDPTERHFCTPGCLRRWLLPLAEHELRQAGIIGSEFPDGTLPVIKREIKHPTTPWDPRVDSPFPNPKPDDGEPPIAA